MLFYTIIIKSSSQPNEVGIFLICRFGDGETEQLRNLLKVTQLVETEFWVKPSQSRQRAECFSVTLVSREGQAALRPTGRHHRELNMAPSRRWTQEKQLM